MKGQGLWYKLCKANLMYVQGRSEGWVRILSGHDFHGVFHLIGPKENLLVYHLIKAKAFSTNVTRRSSNFFTGRKCR